MASNIKKLAPTLDKYKLTRRGKKLQSDKTIPAALLRDIPERTWIDVLQKEETDLMILDIREEIVELAMNIIYKKYMEKQKALFTAHCAAQAWLKLINWHFFRHDPGEDPSAYPPCEIPNRRESWIPDDLPNPSPKDTWCREDLEVVDEIQEEVPRRWSSASSLEMPLVEDIPKEYWFPGKVNICDGSEMGEATETVYEETSSSEIIGTDGEVLQNVTNYSNTNLIVKDSVSSVPETTSSSSHGAGDSTTHCLCNKRDKKIFRKSALSRSIPILPPLPPLVKNSRSHNCVPDRRRNLRIGTQYEVPTEKIDTPQGKLKRK